MTATACSRRVPGLPASPRTHAMTLNTPAPTTQERRPARCRLSGDWGRPPVTTAHVVRTVMGRATPHDAAARKEPSAQGEGCGTLELSGVSVSSHAKQNERLPFSASNFFPQR